MKGFKNDIEKNAVANTNFREVLYTAKNMQLVLMSLKPGEEIGMEVHKESDQFFRFESGTGKCIVDGHRIFD
jgi:mannose-6-phosphate isomerase-like protein (cupin superfamily)